jgi:uridine kinase
MNEGSTDIEKQKSIYCRGPPVFSNKSSYLKEVFVIGIAGGSASGKTVVVRRIVDSIKLTRVTSLSVDSFYKDLTPEHLELAYKNEYNFDHPNAIDFVEIVNVVKKLRIGKKVAIPKYDYSQHKRSKDGRFIHGTDVIIVEGALAFHDSLLVELMDLKIFVNTDDDIRLIRRIKRDTKAFLQ